MKENSSGRKRAGLKVAAASMVCIVVTLWVVVKLNPLIFNESFFGHAHCIKIANGALRIYAQDRGTWPYHTNGFGDAILSFDSVDWPMFTGPGFDTTELREAFEQNRDLDENKIGRIYVQSLAKLANPNIAVLFDQNASPGDHAHGLQRFSARAISKVLEVSAGMQ